MPRLTGGLHACAGAGPVAGGPLPVRHVAVQHAHPGRHGRPAALRHRLRSAHARPAGHGGPGARACKLGGAPAAGGVIPGALCCYRTTPKDRHVLVARVRQIGKSSAHRVQWLVLACSQPWTALTNVAMLPYQHLDSSTAERSRVRKSARLVTLCSLRLPLRC